VTWTWTLEATSRELRYACSRQARAEIEKQLDAVMTRLRQQPRRVYVMEQWTKWGNCSANRDLSFNWRLILAPDFPLRYYGDARGRPLSSARPFDEVLAYSSEPMLGNGAGKAVAQRERAENRGQTGPCLQGGRSTWKASKGLLAPWAAFRLIVRIYRLGIQACDCRLEIVWPAVPGACRILAFGPTAVLASGPTRSRRFADKVIHMGRRGSRPMVIRVSARCCHPQSRSTA
jgi:hypothetical protein